MSIQAWRNLLFRGDAYSVYSFINTVSPEHFVKEEKNRNHIKKYRQKYRQKILVAAKLSTGKAGYFKLIQQLTGKLLPIDHIAHIINESQLTY